MSKVLNNPYVCAAVDLEEAKDKVFSIMAKKLLQTKIWSDMTAYEKKIYLRHVVLQVESEDELNDHLIKKLDVDFSIMWYLPDPGDQAGEEARALLKALGGLVAKNGALVQIMTYEDGMML